MKDLLILLTISFLFVACSMDPEPINLGTDGCAHCSMIIMNPKFASEIVTEKGKVYKYDSIECMLADYSKKFKHQKVLLYSKNFMNESEFINVKNSFILRSDKIKSPMALNLLAFKDKIELEKIKEKYGGDALTFRGAIEYVDKKW